MPGKRLAAANELIKVVNSAKAKANGTPWMDSGARESREPPSVGVKWWATEAQACEPRRARARVSAGRMDQESPFAKYATGDLIGYEENATLLCDQHTALHSPYAVKVGDRQA